jgi:hypothetical protein
MLSALVSERLTQSQATAPPLADPRPTPGSGLTRQEAKRDTCSQKDEPTPARRVGSRSLASLLGGCDGVTM